VNILENVTVCESRLLYGAEIWGSEEGWKYTDKIQRRPFKKVLWSPRSATNGVARLDIQKYSK
jgi:hypothetical protein